MAPERRSPGAAGARKTAATAGRPLGRRPKVAGGGVETRAAILDAAMVLFAERGFDATPVKDVAAQAGVATGLIFHYFGAKDGLLEALIDERTALPLLSSTIDEIAATEPRPGPHEILRRAGTSAYGMARHSAPMLRIMVREVLQRETVRAHWNEARQLAFGALGRALGEASATALDPQAAVDVSRTFLDAVLFEALFGPDADADAVVASIVRTVNLPSDTGGISDTGGDGGDGNG